MDDQDPRPGHIPVRTPDRRLAAPEREHVLRMHAELLADHAPVFRRHLKSRSAGPPIVSLRFSGHVAIDDLWCSCFWGRVLPEYGSGWIVRPTSYDPIQAEVFLTPLPDKLDLEIAQVWSASEEPNPIVAATIGFRSLYPFRKLTFRVLH